jgi:hypothetical protein
LGRKWGRKTQNLDVYFESPAQSSSTRGGRLLHLGRKENTEYSVIPKEFSPLVFQERRLVISFGQKVGKECTVSSDVLYLESPAQLFSTRGDRLVTFGQKVGKESPVSTGIPGESSQIIFHKRRQVGYIWKESGEGEHSIFRYTWRVQPNHFP